MKRGFTLIELLVVIGIMGMLATVSIGGYSAVTRGMAERAALDAATGVAEAALQRAQIDRSRTYLYLFNEVTRADSEDEVGIVCGVAIAVRPVGRITRVVGDLYCDEFGDLNQSYAALDEENGNENEQAQQQSAASVRIYNLRTREIATVREGVYCDNNNLGIDLEDREGDGNGKMQKIKAYGFKKVGGASFQVGDEYGQEFAVMRLPPGFTFSGSVTMSSASDLGMRQVGSVEVIESNDTSAPSLQVYSRRPDGSFKSIGSTSETKDYKRN